MLAYAGEHPDRIVVFGPVEHSLVIDSDCLASMPVMPVLCAIPCRKGKTIKRYSEVLLCDIFDVANGKMAGKRSRGGFIFLLKGGTGIGYSFAWNELYDGPAGDHTLLVFEENGGCLGCRADCSLYVVRQGDRAALCEDGETQYSFAGCCS